MSKSYLSVPDSEKVNYVQTTITLPPEILEKVDLCVDKTKKFACPSCGTIKTESRSSWVMGAILQRLEREK